MIGIKHGAFWEIFQKIEVSNIDPKKAVSIILIIFLGCNDCPNYLTAVHVIIS